MGGGRGRGRGKEERDIAELASSSVDIVMIM